MCDGSVFTTLKVPYTVLLWLFMPNLAVRLQFHPMFGIYLATFLSNLCHFLVSMLDRVFDKVIKFVIENTWRQRHKKIIMGLRSSLDLNCLGIRTCDDPDSMIAPSAVENEKYFKA